MKKHYVQGFQSLSDEVSGIDLQAQFGAIPSSLTGIYLRNGPGKFEAGQDECEHWFDGYALFCKFSFDSGKLTYSNKFVRSRSYEDALAHNKINYASFSTYPKLTKWQRFIAWFTPMQSGQNTNVSLIKFGGRYFALTETPELVEFDIDSLSTINVIEFDGTTSGKITTAHPHYDFTNKELINLVLQPGKTSRYCYYRVRHDILNREKIGSIDVRLPSYTHSFGITKNYIIHVDCPLVVNPLRLRFGNLPYIKCYEWRPEQGTRITLMDRHSGEIVKQYRSEAFFMFHHINAFEQNSVVYFDVAAKRDAGLIEDLYLEHLRRMQSRPIRQHSEFRRYCLRSNSDQVTYTVISNEYIELPTINYQDYNGESYRYAYGVGYNPDLANDFENQLIKIDTLDGSSKNWFEKYCYPGEPLFVAAPQSSNEDEGVILSVVLDGEKNQSFLLVLDAKSFQVEAKCYLPHVVPFGFHGKFFR